MKKIIILSRNSLTLNLFFKEIVKHFENNNIQVKLSCADIENISISCFDRIKFRSVTLNNILFNPFNIIFLFFELFSIGKKHKDHIFLINTPLISHLFRFSTYFMNLKIIYFVHGYRFHNKGNFFLNNFYKFLEIIFSYNTKAYININSFDYNFTNLILKKKSIKINGVGIDISKKSNNFKKNNNDFIVGIIGAYKKNKGYEDLIKLCRNSNIDKNIKFVCFGYGDLNRYLSIKRKNKINNLELNNFTNDIYSEIDKFNILLHLSYREGLPVSLIQCLLRGKPVLCYNIRGCKDLIKHNHNGFIFELGNINAIVSSINYLKNNNTIIEKMSSNAISSINHEFSNEFIADSIFNFVNKI